MAIDRTEEAAQAARLRLAVGPDTLAAIQSMREMEAAVGRDAIAAIRTKHEMEASIGLATLAGNLAQRTAGETFTSSLFHRTPADLLAASMIQCSPVEPLPDSLAQRTPRDLLAASMIRCSADEAMADFLSQARCSGDKAMAELLAQQAAQRSAVMSSLGTLMGQGGIAATLAEMQASASVQAWRDQYAAQIDVKRLLQPFRLDPAAEALRWGDVRSEFGHWRDQNPWVMGEAGRALSDAMGGPADWLRQGLQDVESTLDARTDEEHDAKPAELVLVAELAPAPAPVVEADRAPDTGQPASADEWERRLLAVIKAAPTPAQASKAFVCFAALLGVSVSAPERPAEVVPLRAVDPEKDRAQRDAEQAAAIAACKPPDGFRTGQRWTVELRALLLAQQDAMQAAGLTYEGALIELHRAWGYAKRSDKNGGPLAKVLTTARRERPKDKGGRTKTG